LAQANPNAISKYETMPFRRVFMTAPLKDGLKSGPAAVGGWERG
jgi:hypothetical protein